MTKYDPENLVVLCVYHHDFFHKNPVEQVEWMLKRLGQEAFDLLRVRSNTYCKKDPNMELIKAKEFLKLTEANQ